MKKPKFEKLQISVFSRVLSYLFEFLSVGGVAKVGITKSDVLLLILSLLDTQRSVFVYLYQKDRHKMVKIPAVNRG